jgi:hypothetical protein
MPPLEARSAGFSTGTCMAPCRCPAAVESLCRPVSFSGSELNEFYRIVKKLPVFFSDFNSNANCGKTVYRPESGRHIFKQKGGNYTNTAPSGRGKGGRPVYIYI